MSETENQKLNFIKNENIYIYGAFDDSILKDVVPGFQKLIQDKWELKEAEITININSHGGYIYALKNLLGLIEYAKSLDIVVSTIVLGVAYSCGSMLAASGTPGYRFIGDHAEHLIHLGQGGFVVSNDIELEREAAYLKKHFNFVRSIYKKYAKIKNLNKVIHDDNYFITGKDIITNGLADKILKA